jgi:predicted kinase
MVKLPVFRELELSCAAGILPLPPVSLTYLVVILANSGERIYQQWYNTFMKRKPIVYLICGFIGAGKTTFAKKLEEKTGAVRITKDEWSICLIGNDPTIDGYEEWDTKIIELSRDIAFQLAEKGIDVIIDEGFWAKEERDELRRKIDAIGAKAVMYYVDTPIETIRERVVGRNNNLTKDSFKISREMLDNYLKYWQPPREDEDYILASEVK